MRQHILSFLEQHQLNHADSLLVVGFSGGLDSSVLLHGLVQLQRESLLMARLHAVYIDHGLQDLSTTWSHHCAAECTAYSIPFQAIRINAKPARGQSPEQAARQGRYQAFKSFLAQQQLSPTLLTAHHQNDQAETLLLQLMRGAGASGLSAMPGLKPLGVGQQGRPLLNLSHSELEFYAADKQLKYKQDPSNQDDSFDRNFLRNQVMPLLQQRWPSASKTIARSASLLAEQQELLNTELQQSLAEYSADDLFSPPSTIAPSKLSALLRLWLHKQGASMPSQAVLAQVQALLNSPAQGEVAWGAGEARVLIRSYGNSLYCCAWYIEQQRKQFQASAYTRWEVATVLKIPALGLELSQQLLQQQGIQLPDGTQELELKFDQPSSSRLYLQGHKHSKSLKNTFQEAKIPPWLRAYCPLLYLNGKLHGIVLITHN